MEKIYFTKQGLKEIERERQILLQLKKEKRDGKHPEILHSEEVNPEYLSYLEDADLLEVKLTDLEYIIKHAEIIKPPSKKDQNAIVLGARVFLESENDKNEFELVNTFEADPIKGKISIESPLGKNLLGHRKGEEIILANNHKKYKIKKISYHHLA
ncbi:MAG: GreA/GreB family elongation factor [Candidatus Pacebacteria bacterium]|nr:GreA/GreB family elongation factor [Candidatus Paceibacterota bacterium]